MERFCPNCLKRRPLAETRIYEDDTHCPVCGEANPYYDPGILEQENRKEAAWDREGYGIRS